MGSVCIKREANELDKVYGFTQLCIKLQEYYEEYLREYKKLKAFMRHSYKYTDAFKVILTTN
jgi:hypothetical protein